MKFSFSFGVATTGMALVVLLSSLNSAAAAINADEALTALTAAKTLWKTSGVNNYQYIQQQLCECLPDQTRPILVRVNPNGDIWGQFADLDGDVTPAVVEKDMVGDIGNMVLVPDSIQLYSFEELFAKIETAINGNYFSLDVTYDAKYGFPTSLNIDQDEQIIDEEFIFTATSFKIILDDVVDPDPSDVSKTPQDYLSAAMALWESQEIVNYDYQYALDCFCEPKFFARKTVSVRKNQITQVQFVEDDQLELPEEVPQEVIKDILDVNGLFDKIQDAINDEDAIVTIEYDAKYGYPTSILIDYKPEVADDEFRAKLSSLVLVEVNKIDYYTTIQATLDTQKSVWASNNLMTYEFEYKKECRCLEEIRRPKVISVVDNEIESAVYSDDVGGEVSENIISLCPTIDELFNTIQDAIDGESDEIEVTYNTPYGYPESIYIDPSTGAADDETSLTIGPLTASGSGGRIPGNGTDENGDSPTVAPATKRRRKKRTF
mmetsp:Transcript_24452/g.34456  ORF Transcript_24452/g.34456 Transcript_24452/m.34456 type:complete len:491 (+) Transcript_24452:133-1605(+)